MSGAAGIQQLGSAVRGETWGYPATPGSPYQSVSEVYLHTPKSGPPELWAKVEFQPWFKAFANSPDQDGDGFPEVYGRVRGRFDHPRNRPQHPARLHGDRDGARRGEEVGQPAIVVLVSVFQYRPHGGRRSVARSTNRTGHQGRARRPCLQEPLHRSARQTARETHLRSVRGQDQRYGRRRSSHGSRCGEVAQVTSRPANASHHRWGHPRAGDPSP